MYEELLSQRLTSLRMSKNVSAREMSLAIGQSPGYINTIENQKNFPSMQVFFYICEYLGVTPAEFWDVDNKYPHAYKEIIYALNKLDPHMLIHVKSVLIGLYKK